MALPVAWRQALRAAPVLLQQPCRRSGLFRSSSGLFALRRRLLTTVATTQTTGGAQPLAQRRPLRHWVALGGGAATVLTAAALAADEGLRRCIEFWLVVLPIYLQYLYVDRVSNPAGQGEEEARAAAFERLHIRHSPTIERATLRMRGFYLKAAQIMSMRDDFLPEPYLTWTRKLQNEAPVTLGGPAARRCVAEELGLASASSTGDLTEVFTEWEDEPIGSASIGQVFRAKLRSTGEPVAVKVQSPGIEGLFRADIRTLKFFTAFALPWAVENMNAIERMFESEFDYNLERRNLEVIRESLLPRWGHQIRVPKPFAELCTPRVLCMELLEGEKLVDGVRRHMRTMAEREGRSPEAYEEEHLDALRSGRATARSARSMRWRTAAWRWWRWLRWGESAGEVLDLASLMETLMAIHGEQVFRHGIFNADPHPGNILLLKDGRTLGLIDFGQVRDLTMSFRLQLARLIIALAERDAASVAQLERACGMRTRHAKPDVRYRVCSFWLDRDTEDVLQGLNLHDFMAWGEREDPVLEYPEDLYLVCRCSVMIRSLALAFGVRLSTAEYWRPHAEALLRENGIEV